MAGEPPVGSASFGFDASGKARVHAGHVYNNRYYYYNGALATPPQLATTSSDASYPREADDSTRLSSKLDALKFESNNDAGTAHICDHTPHFKCQTDLDTIATSGCVRGLERYLGAKEKRKEIEDWRGRYEYYSSHDPRTGHMLHFSAARGHLHMVQALCKITENIFMLDCSNPGASGSERGPTVLHVAASHGREEVIEFLLKEASRCYTDGYGASPLHAAVRFPAVMTRLLEAGYHVDWTDRAGDSALHIAALQGAKAGAQFLLDNNARLEHKNKAGFTPLHVASRRGRSEVVTLLLGRRADILAKDSSGATPLHLAASFSKTENVRLLLEHGADVAVLDKRGRTPLDLAALWGDAESARLLLNRGASFETTSATDAWNACHIAVDSGRMDMVELLLGCEAMDVTRTTNKRTLLHVAAFHGHAKIARLLLDYGADVAAKTGNRWTPLHTAASQGRIVTARILLDAGSDILAKSMDGLTPLHLAVRCGQENMVRLLLARGADARDTDDDGNTPLQVATIALGPAYKEQYQSITRILSEHEKKNSS